MVVQLLTPMAGPFGTFCKDDRVDFPQPQAEQLIASRAAARTLLPATRVLKVDLDALALSLKERELALDVREKALAEREAAMNQNQSRLGRRK